MHFELRHGVFGKKVKLQFFHITGKLLDRLFHILDITDFSGIFSIDQTSQKNKAVSLQQILMSDMRSDTKLLALTGI